MTEEYTLIEQQLMEMRIELLSQQEMTKLKSNAELLKTLHGLNKTIKETMVSVQKAAHEVRGYPAEVISQASARIEQSIRNCEQSAARAQKSYDMAQELIIRIENIILWSVFGAALMSTMLVASVLMWFWGR